MRGQTELEQYDIDGEAVIKPRGFEKVQFETGHGEDGPFLAYQAALLEAEVAQPFGTGTLQERR